MINPGELQLKNMKVLKGLAEHEFHPALWDIIEYVWYEYGVVLTETYRYQRHANDLHGTDPVRALDLRHWVYTPGLAEKINDEINRRWRYDPNRPERVVSVIHDVGMGIHFHIQVHPNTIRIDT